MADQDSGINRVGPVPWHLHYLTIFGLPVFSKRPLTQRLSWYLLCFAIVGVSAYNSGRTFRNSSAGTNNVENIVFSITAFSYLYFGGSVLIIHHKHWLHFRKLREIACSPVGVYLKALWRSHAIFILVSDIALTAAYVSLFIIQNNYEVAPWIGIVGGFFQYAWFQSLPYTFAFYATVHSLEICAFTRKLPALIQEHGVNAAIARHDIIVTSLRKTTDAYSIPLFVWMVINLGQALSTAISFLTIKYSDKIPRGLMLYVGIFSVIQAIYVLLPLFTAAFLSRQLAEVRYAARRIRAGLFSTTVAAPLLPGIHEGARMSPVGYLPPPSALDYGSLLEPPSSIAMVQPMLAAQSQPISGGSISSTSSSISLTGRRSRGTWARYEDDTEPSRLSSSDPTTADLHTYKVQSQVALDTRTSSGDSGAPDPVEEEESMSPGSLDLTAVVPKGMSLEALPDAQLSPTAMRAMQVLDSFMLYLHTTPAACVLMGVEITPSLLAKVGSAGVTIISYYVQTLK